jgi:hypothetical protein
MKANCSLDNCAYGIRYEDTLEENDDRECEGCGRTFYNELFAGHDTCPECRGIKKAEICGNCRNWLLWVCQGHMVQVGERLSAYDTRAKDCFKYREKIK